MVLSFFALFFSRLLFSLVVFFFFLSIAVRFVMTPLFLFVEYTRPAFPADVYGFSVLDRFTYSAEVLHYLVGRGAVLDLEGLSFLDGSSLFDEREVAHLIDVYTVVQLFFLISSFVVIVLIFCLVISRFNMTMRILLCQGIRWGSYLIIGVIIAIVVNAVFNWDFFFTTFHKLFFADGTWLFEYSNSLIRLFPEQFWFDASVVVGILSVTLAIFTLLIILRLPYWQVHT